MIDEEMLAYRLLRERRVGERISRAERAAAMLRAGSPERVGVLLSAIDEAPSVIKSLAQIAGIGDLAAQVAEDIAADDPSASWAARRGLLALAAAGLVRGRGGES